MGKFNTKESYKHKMAKELLLDWINTHGTTLLDQYGKYITPSGLKGVIEYPMFQEYDSAKFKYIFDLGFTNKGSQLHLAVEICNTSKAKENKINYCKDNHIGLYEVDVNDILNQLSVPKVVKCTTLNPKKEFEKGVLEFAPDVSKEYPIVLFNKYYSVGDPQQLTPKELYTLITLKEHSSKINGKAVTTNGLIGHLLPFTNHKECRRNAYKAKEMMQSLRSKGIIEYDEPKDSNEPITVSIESVQYIEGDLRTSFQPIPEFILERTNDPNELYVLIAILNIAKMCEKGGYSIPYFRNKKRWGNLLECSNTTAYKIIERMIKKKILYWYENDKKHENGMWSQFDGKYFIYPQEKEEERIRLRDAKRKLNKKASGDV